jgi:hypothetical protein
MADSSRGLLGRLCCDDRLKPQPSRDQFSVAVETSRGKPADRDSVHGCADDDGPDLRQRLGAQKVAFVSTGHGLFDLTAEVCGFIGRPLSKRKLSPHGADGRRSRWKRWPVSRAYFDAQLSWHGYKPTQPVLDHRASYWLWGSTRRRTRHRAWCRAAPGWMDPRRSGTTV